MRGNHLQGKAVQGSKQISLLPPSFSKTRGTNLLDLLGYGRYPYPNAPAVRACVPFELRCQLAPGQRDLPPLPIHRTGGPGALLRGRGRHGLVVRDGAGRPTASSPNDSSKTALRSRSSPIGAAIHGGLKKVHFFLLANIKTPC